MYKVFVVDDEIVIREGIRNRFPWDEAGFTLCGEAPDGEIALSMLQELRPDILITDIRMPFLDGIALCRQVSRTMPWIQIIILSGYDEFGYAREAMSLGVKDYLLKPVNALELEKALQRVADTIRAERAREADLSALRAQMASSSGFLLERLLIEWLDGQPAQTVAERARKLGINLFAQQYAVMLARPAPGNKATDLHPMLRKLADGYRGTVFSCALGQEIALIVLGDTPRDLQERTYAFSQAVGHEAERAGRTPPGIAIGAPVADMAALPRSLDAAQSILQTMEGTHRQVMSVADFDAGVPQDLLRLDVAPLYEKVQYAATREVPGIVDAYFDSLGGMAAQSLMIANYMLVDTMLVAMRVIKQSGGEPEAVLPEVLEQGSLLASMRSPEHVLATCKDLLTRALSFRDSQSLSRYGDIIRKACAYIEENYRTPEVTLRDVAAHVALSTNHFCTIFAQEMGSTFIEHLTRVRMDKAKEYLSTTDLRSLQIAELVGYNDAHYFSYLFKKYAGMSPREFRQMHRGKSGM